MLAEANARLQRWRTATQLPAGPDATDVVARVRRYLADDLDTPKALAALDGWSTDALEYGGHDAEAPRTVATAIDALLGVQALEQPAKASASAVEEGTFRGYGFGERGRSSIVTGRPAESVPKRPVCFAPRARSWC